MYHPCVKRICQVTFCGSIIIWMCKFICLFSHDIILEWCLMFSIT